MSRKKFGEILLEDQLINSNQLNDALERQKLSKKPLGKILEEMDIILEEDIAKALSRQFGFPFARQIARHKFPQSILDIIDAETALAHLVFPVKLDGKTLYLAMANPLNMTLQSNLAFKLNLRIAPCVSTPTDIKAAIEKHYKDVRSPAHEDRSWNILIVDNQEPALNAAQAALVKEGFTVHQARNGVEGLKMAVQHMPNLIITEIALPRMDGIELFKSLRDNPTLEDILVIAYSGKSTAEDEYKLLEMGFYDFIAKPINPIRLQARVKRAVRWRGCTKA
ncbi:MAG: response regulator [Pelovirga sp.]